MAARNPFRQSPLRARWSVWEIGPKMFERRSNERARPFLSIVVELRPVVAIGLLNSPGSLGEHPKKLLAKSLRSEQPSPAQTRRHRKLRLAIAIGKARPGQSRIAPVHPPLQQAKKLPPPAGCIGTSANLKTGCRFHPRRSLARGPKIMRQTAPLIPFNAGALLDNPRPYWVEVDVIEQRPTAVSRLHQDRLVTASKEMPPEPVPRVHATREGVLQPSHPAVPLRGFQQKMVVVGHQHKAMHPKPAPFARFAQRVGPLPSHFSSSVTP
jgi:hypothetical protein